jgi:hypothetical protein
MGRGVNWNSLWKRWESPDPKNAALSVEATLPPTPSKQELLGALDDVAEWHNMQQKVAYDLLRKYIENNA